MHAALGLSALLLMLLLGVFLEGWQSGDGPSDVRDPQDLAEAVADLLSPSFPREPNGTAEAVFAVLAARADPSEVAKVIQHLPTALRNLWPIYHRAA